MSRPPRATVSQEELDSLFEALNIWDKIQNSLLTSEPIIEARLPSRDYIGGVSDIVRHKNLMGYQVATSHRITADDGSIPHWHGKDLRIGDVLLRPI